jgi:biotin carboxyl carrier protein
MKMENILKAPVDGVVKSIKIKPGDKVDKNEVLLNLA